MIYIWRQFTFGDKCKSFWKSIMFCYMHRASAPNPVWICFLAWLLLPNSWIWSWNSTFRAVAVWRSTSQIWLQRDVVSRLLVRVLPSTAEQVGDVLGAWARRACHHRHWRIHPLRTVRAPIDLAQAILCTIFIFPYLAVEHCVGTLKLAVLKGGISFVLPLCSRTSFCWL